jgi:hypothetical protein|tara:strand:- start:225 stop:548 length:324 start_codon:yes stop_codon:yes gene_type:complete
MVQTMDMEAAAAVDEMAIVDTFTKLIFEQESHYSGSELGIIHTLRMIDDNVTLDCHRAMGVYLRALGVREMIGLVSKVSNCMARGAHLERPSMHVLSELIPGLAQRH